MPVYTHTLSLLEVELDCGVKARLGKQEVLVSVEAGRSGLVSKPGCGCCSDSSICEQSYDCRRFPPVFGVVVPIDSEQDNLGPECVTLST